MEDRRITEEKMQEIVERALEAKLGAFFVEREQHFLDHKFICDIREGTDKIRTAACGVVTKLGITGIFSLLLYGIIYFIRREAGK